MSDPERIERDTTSPSMRLDDVEDLLGEVHLF
jgi:hypothetical protein